MAQQREPLMDAKYFNWASDFNKAEIAKFEVLGHDPTKKPAHRMSLLYTVFKDNLHEVIVRYSRGDEVGDLVPLYEPIIAAWEDYLKQEFSRKFRFDVDDSNLEDYVVALWLVSLAIIFNVDDGVFDRMLQCLSGEGKDILLDRLLETRTGRAPAATGLAFPKVYDPLYSTIDNVAKRSDLMKVFLKKWYPAMKPTYFYNCHKGPEGGGFFGYWAIEAAGVTVAFNMDDQAYADLPYYPRDLAHFKA